MIFVAQMLLGMVLFALLVELNYVQMRSELEYAARLTRNLTAAQPGTVAKPGFTTPEGFVLSKP